MFIDKMTTCRTKRERQVRRAAKRFGESCDNYVVAKKTVGGGTPFMRIWSIDLKEYHDIMAGPKGTWFLYHHTSDHLLRWMKRKGLTPVALVQHLNVKAR